MQINKLDHVNVRTSRLAEMVDWYKDVLDMPSGARPNFPFGGAWLYIGDQAAVHLVEVEDDPNHSSLKLEHFALSATGLPEFVDKLKARGIAHSIDPVPGIDVVQVNLHDIDGNHIHVDFEASEAQGL